MPLNEQQKKDLLRLISENPQEAIPSRVGKQFLTRCVDVISKN